MEDAAPVDTIDADGMPRAVQLGRNLHLRIRPNAPLQLLLTGHMDTVFAEDHPFQDLTWLDDERFTEVVYFTSEQDARSAESTEFPGGVQALFGELMQVMDDLKYMDLPDPWLFTPTEDLAPRDTRGQAFRPTRPSVAGGDEAG